MGRRRAFDEEVALDNAISCFWARGYGSTSVRILCEAMGIGSGSFYSAFVDKETCFRLALTRYLTQQAVPQKPSLSAISQWFAFVIRVQREHRGCMLVGAAGQWEELDSGNREFVRVQLQRLEDFFWMCLKPRPKAREDASMLATAVLGIHLMSFAGMPNESLKRSAQAALRAVGLTLPAENSKMQVDNSGTCDT